MRDVMLIQKELSEMTGRKARLGSPDDVIYAPRIEYIICKCGSHLKVTISKYSPPLPSGAETKYCPVCGREIPLVTYVTSSVEIAQEVIGDEDPRFQDLLRQIAEQERKLAELRAEIARLEALVGVTPEDEARLAELQRFIEEAEAEVAEWQAKVTELEVQVPLWKARRDTARLLLNRIALNKAERFESFPDYGKRLEYYILPGEAELAYLSAWNLEAIEEIAALKDKFQKALEPPTFWHDIRGIREDEFQDLLEEARARGEVVPTPAPWWPSKHDFNIHKWSDLFVKYVTELVGRGESEIAVHLRETYGIGYMPWIYPDAASIWRSKLSPQEALASSKYESLFAELTAARDSLERAKRRLWDAKAAKERAELEIRRAIALRQAEVDAAKARYELELRTLDNLKATYDVLLKEIELAKLQAIAEAARQREEVIKADEEERLAIAEEMRRIAEEAERKAEEALGIAREEYLDRMRRALEIAKEAEEAAIAAALEREATAKEIATRKAELAQTELELEELRKQLAITEERKEEAEKAVAGLPALPKWFWPVAGIAGAGLGVTGIGLALRKKKKAK